MPETHSERSRGLARGRLGRLPRGSRPWMNLLTTPVWESCQNRICGAADAERPDRVARAAFGGTVDANPRRR